METYLCYLQNCGELMEYWATEWSGCGYGGYSAGNGSTSGEMSYPDGSGHGAGIMTLQMKGNGTGYGHDGAEDGGSGYGDGGRCGYE